MERLTTNKRVLVGAGLAVLIAAGSGIGLALRAAQEQPDILKLSTNSPVLILSYVRADKTTEFEEGWAGVRDLIAKSENAEMKSFADSLTNLFKVDQDPIDVGGNKAHVYMFRLDSPSTQFSYNPGKILYVDLKAGLDGSKVTRAEADAVYNKLQAAYLSIPPPWKLVKVSK